MTTDDARKPIYDLSWVNARELHDGKWPDPDDELDPVACIRVAHDSVLYAIRQLDRLEVSKAMEDVRDAIKRLNDPVRFLDGRPAEKAAKGRATLQDVRTLLRDDDLEQAENYLHEARDWLRESLDAMDQEMERLVPGSTNIKGQSTTVVDSDDDTPDPTVELSDAICFPKEDLQLLEIAALEAHRRDKQFSELLRWKIRDVRQQLEDAQGQAAERLQERRGTLAEELSDQNGGADGE